MSSLLSWYVYSLLGGVNKPIDPDDATSLIIKNIKKHFGEERTPRYVVLLFLGFCHDNVIEQLQVYIDFQERETSSVYKIVFIDNVSNDDQFFACKKLIRQEDIISGRTARELLRLCGLRPQREATFILDMTNESIVTVYNYLLNAKIFKELIEVLKK